MPLLWSKRMKDFRAGKFASLPLAIQGHILINASHGASALSEGEIESLIELKTAER